MTTAATDLIDPLGVPGLYQRIGHKPLFGGWFYGPGPPTRCESCILIAVAFQRLGEEEGRRLVDNVRAIAPTTQMNIVADALGFTREYADGVVHGWDRTWPRESRHSLRRRPEYRLGRIHGGLARREMRNGCELRRLDRQKREGR